MNFFGKKKQEEDLQHIITTLGGTGITAKEARELLKKANDDARRKRELELEALKRDELHKHTTAADEQIRQAIAARGDKIDYMLGYDMNAEKIKDLMVEEYTNRGFDARGDYHFSSGTGGGYIVRISWDK